MEGKPSTQLLGLSVSTAGGDHLKILARHCQRLASAGIEALEQVGQVASEAGLPLGVERREGFEHRAVVGAEDLDKMLGRAIAEYKEALGGRDLRDAVREKFADTLLGAPLRRRFNTGRR